MKLPPQNSNHPLPQRRTTTLKRKGLALTIPASDAETLRSLTQEMLVKKNIIPPDQALQQVRDTFECSILEDGVSIRWEGAFTTLDSNHTIIHWGTFEGGGQTIGGYVDMLLTAIHIWVRGG